MDRYEAWKNACDRIENSVKEWNEDKSKPRCPLCGGKATARWDYDGDYDIHVFIECEDCSCRVKGSRIDEVDAQWCKRVDSKVLDDGKKVDGLMHKVGFLAGRLADVTGGSEEALLKLIDEVHSELSQIADEYWSER